MTSLDLKEASANACSLLVFRHVRTLSGEQTLLLMVLCFVADVSERSCSPDRCPASWRASPGPGRHSDSSVLLCHPLASGADSAGNYRGSAKQPKILFHVCEKTHKGLSGSANSAAAQPFWPHRDSEPSRDSTLGVHRS